MSKKMFKRFVGPKANFNTKDDKGNYRDFKFGEEVLVTEGQAIAFKDQLLTEEEFKRLTQPENLTGAVEVEISDDDEDAATPLNIDPDDESGEPEESGESEELEEPEFTDKD
jgi:hypothetical protein